jgi:hypothetical protein
MRCLAVNIITLDSVLFVISPFLVIEKILRCLPELKFYFTVFCNIFLSTCFLAEQHRVLVYYPIPFCGKPGRMM